MKSSAVLAGVGLLASTAIAAPYIPLTEPLPLLSKSDTPLTFTDIAAGPTVPTKGRTVVYWGQNGGGTVENNDLSHYCTAGQGIDVLVLAFIYSFGSGNSIPSGTIGQSCYISTAGQGQNCENVASSIAKCQAAGVDIILSLGGAAGSYTLTSDSDAKQIAQYLWNSYGNSGNTTVQRPFGDNFVNGFDFDIEVPNGQQYYPTMIKELRDNFASDPDNTYYITGAPQCPLPEPNMGAMIANSTFDWLWPQFYNNNNYTYPCALPFNGNAAFNYDQWVNFTADTPSKDAQIFIGLPASTLGANGSPSGATYYITPDQLAELVDEYQAHTRFGGVMMWNAGFSDANTIDDCTYAQQVHNILETGETCSGSGSGYPGTSSSSSSTTTTATYTTFTTTLPTIYPITGGSSKSTITTVTVTDTTTIGVSTSITTTTATVKPTTTFKATTTTTLKATTTATVGPTTTITQPASTATSPAGSGIAQWQQCGGNGYSGSTVCQSPYTCVELSQWWSQCE